ncbi:MAG TPA: hypothetical protein VGA78_09625 [Gemmatimonadales bacterium]
MTTPRDWDKELAEIDKLMSKQPAQVPALAGAPGALPATRGPSPQPGRPQASGPAPVTRKARFATWFQVLLGAVAGAAMTQWPYANSCGVGLFLYLGAAGVVSLAGLWGSLSSWRRRMGLAHSLSLLVTLWGLLLVGAVVLPRIGYATQAATWFCP